jgi:chemotaxis protein methyltransferase CheR
VTAAGAGALPGTPTAPGIDRQQVEALLDHLFVQTGLDFRRYARRSIERRLQHVLMQEGLASVEALRVRVAGRGHDAALDLAHRICVTVTTLFRDPEFWIALRTLVAPALRELPFVRVWSAGCATGEEAYSLAILLREEGLAGRTRIYATDVDEDAILRARSAQLPLEHMREYTRNYLRAGGTRSFSEYYTVSGESASLAPSLLRHVLFSRHNLATDASFNEFHLILCRNVLIYFEDSLQEQAHEVFRRSLAARGVLGLGLREIVPSRRAEASFEALDPARKLYRRR